jgi:uncharacterized protein (DUF2252 family)
MIGDLLSTLENRKRKDLLDHYCPQDRDGKRHFRPGSEHLDTVDKATSEHLGLALESYAATQPDPHFFKPLDYAFHIAGTGSRGLPRYLVLVHGKGSPDSRYLLDLKFSPPSALATLIGRRQPAWADESERVVAIQQRMQAMPPRFSTTIHVNSKPYVMRALQPAQDRLKLSAGKGDMTRIETVTSTMARLLAWAQLRGSGHQGAAPAEALIAFGHNPSWHGEMLDYAQAGAAGMEADWQAFARHDFD